MFVRNSLLALAVALAATAPALAQKLSLAERVAALEAESRTRGSASGQANVDLLNRLTQLQSEVQALRNQVEQLQNDNEQLKQRARDQYVDLDTRLQKLEGSAPAPTASAPPLPATRPVVAPPIAAPAPAPSSAAAPTPTAPIGDEQTAYGEAFDALKRGDYVASARGFQAFLGAYPNATLAPNAWYWLGESYYVTQNYPIAQRAFEALLGQFPDSGKAPDALLKKGYCQVEMHQVEPGRQTLSQVIQQYPDSDAARLAQSRLRTLNLEPR